MTKEEIIKIDNNLQIDSKTDNILIKKRGFYAYYNKPNKSDRDLIIHHHTCGNCFYGIGKITDSEMGLNGIWIGPSITIKSLQNHIKEMFNEEANLCSSCIKKGES